MIFTKIFGSKKDIANAVRDLTSTISGEVKNAYDGKGFFAGILAGQDELKKALGDTFDSSKVDDYIASLNGLSETQKIAVINSSNLTKAQKAEMLARINNTKATEANTGANAANSASDVADTSSNTANTASTVADTVATIDNTNATIANTGANAANSASDVADTISNVANTASNFGSKLKGIGTGLLSVVKKHPVATGVIAALTGGVIALNIYKKKAQAIKEAHEDAEQALEDTKKSLSEEKSELQTVNSELETTQEKIKEISSLGTLTLTEQNELTKLSNANDQLKIQQK